MNKLSYFRFEIISNKLEAIDTYRIRLHSRSEKNYSFLPGQYCYLQIPGFEIAKPFSIASAPEENFVEFCVKNYGPFSKALTMLQPGDIIQISEPTGSFIWDDLIHNASFLIGGIGISPIMSILSHIEKTDQRPTLTLFYGNRTPETKAFATELSELQKLIPLRVVDIYSDLDTAAQWSGYRGFLTKEILQKELVDLSATVFFLVGPPVFLEKMKAILGELNVLSKNINTELIS